jgi:superfamily II DNA/RNA helicase
MPSLPESNFGYDFPLSDFQSDAMAAIQQHRDVLVSAPTGSGKTLPAEFAIKYHTTKGQKVLYTTPIKTLSNQKYHDFSVAYPDLSVGLVTGDLQMNPGGDVVVLTTEILRNTLIGQTNETPTLFQINMAEVGCVVFDEFHYICDKNRGEVWEACIVAIPPHIALVMLSATLSRREELCEWIGKARRGGAAAEGAESVATDPPIQPLLCTSTVRHVPLYHSIWLSGPRNIAKTEKDKAMIERYDAMANRAIPIYDTTTSRFDSVTYDSMNRVKHYLMRTHNNPRPIQILNDVVRHLRDSGLTPAIIFVLSRAKLEMYAQQITVPLIDPTTDITVEYAGTVRRRCEQILRGKIDNWQEYQNLPEFQMVVGLLEKGIGIHHAGMLPLIREMVEMMFVQKQIKVLFATETFAVGLNMPTKTTVFTSLKKFDGTSNRFLESAEYTQMAGRAGRRGIDTEGHSIICANMFEPPDTATMRGIISGNPRSVVSRLKLSYGMILENDTARLTERSMLREEIITELQGIDSQLAVLDTELAAVLEDTAESSKSGTESIPAEVMLAYETAERRLASVSGNQIRKVKRDMARIKADYPTIGDYTESNAAADELRARIETGRRIRGTTARYIEDSLSRVRLILLGGEFIELRHDSPQHLTPTGHIASVVRESHPLAFIDTYMAMDGFRGEGVRELTIFLASFIGLRGADDAEDRLYEPTTEYTDGSIGSIGSGTHSVPISVLRACAEYKSRFEHYATEETKYEISVPEYKQCRIGHIDLYARWYDAADEISAKQVLLSAAARGIFAGDFVKGVMSVVALAREMELVCDLDCNLETKSQLAVVGEGILKFIATNQSLYV